MAEIMNSQFQYPSSAASLFSCAARQTREQDLSETCVCLERIGDNGSCPVHSEQNAQGPDSLFVKREKP